MVVGWDMGVSTEVSNRQSCNNCSYQNRQLLSLHKRNQFNKTNNFRHNIDRRWLRLVAMHAIMVRLAHETTQERLRSGFHKKSRSGH